MAILSVNRPEPAEKKEKRDPWEDIIKGLQVAQSITGIATNVQQFGINKLQKERYGLEVEKAKAEGAEQEKLRTSLANLEEKNILDKTLRNKMPTFEQRVPGSKEAFSEDGKKIFYFPNQQEANYWLSREDLEKKAKQTQFLNDNPIGKKDIIQIRQGLIKNIADSDEGKALATRADAYNSIKSNYAAYKRALASGDTKALGIYTRNITNLAEKLLQPNSTVMPAEYESVLNSQALTEQLRTKIAALQTGENLSPTSIDAIYRVAVNMTANNVDAFFRGPVATFLPIGREIGLKESDLINPYLYSLQKELSNNRYNTIKDDVDVILGTAVPVKTSNAVGQAIPIESQAQAGPYVDPLAEYNKKMTVKQQSPTIIPYAPKRSE